MVKRLGAWSNRFIRIGDVGGTSAPASLRSVGAPQPARTAISTSNSMRWKSASRDRGAVCHVCWLAFRGAFIQTSCIRPRRLRTRPRASDWISPGRCPSEFETMLGAASCLSPVNDTAVSPGGVIRLSPPSVDTGHDVSVTVRAALVALRSAPPHQADRRRQGKAHVPLLTVSDSIMSARWSPVSRSIASRATRDGTEGA